MVIRATLISFFTIVILGVSACSPSNQQTADLILTNAKIYTVDSMNTWAEAVAIKEGKFIYVGTEQNVGAFIGPQTKTYDLKEAMVLPGIIDAHTHPGSIAIRDNYDSTKKSGYPNMPYPASKEEILAWLENYSKKNPDLEMIVAGVW